MTGSVSQRISLLLQLSYMRQNGLIRSASKALVVVATNPKNA